MRVLQRSEREVEEVHARALDGVAEGSRFPGLSYEEGVDNTIRWLTGESDEEPISKEDVDNARG